MARTTEALAELSRRAESVREAADAAHAEPREALADRVERARAQAATRADSLREHVGSLPQDGTDRWNQVQIAWKDHVRTVRTEVQDKQAEANPQRAERRAERAEDYSHYALAFALAALEEAEYAVLDAALARADARGIVYTSTPEAVLA